MSHTNAIHQVELKPMRSLRPARLRPEVVPAPSAAGAGFDLVFTVRLLRARHEVLLLQCRVVR